MINVYELNLDGLVGPSHHYAGLSHGNIASMSNALSVSNPAKAAHQGVEKMRLLHRAGIKQALMPPHQRPNFDLLQQLGFRGTPAAQLKQAKNANPILLSACYSASSMWAANAATVSASLDTLDNRVHFTAANLISNLHRHQEGDFSRRLLQRLFQDERHFVHHPLLPKTAIMSDEGAANHSRLCANHSEPGLSLFVYGKQALKANHLQKTPVHFPARQTYEASQAIARGHNLNPAHVIFACQNPEAIDQGVFHNDVIAVANESILFLHEDGFQNQSHVLAEIRAKASFSINIIEVSRQHITVLDAVNSYLFNSQLITLPDKQMALIAPIECEQHPGIKAYLDDVIADLHNPIRYVHYVDLRQSMQNGGGPACLRLRIPLTEKELAAMHAGVLVDESLLNTLDQWIDKHYRTSLHRDDLEDPALINECFSALDELTHILNLGSLYPFQTL